MIIFPWSRGLKVREEITQENMKQDGTDHPKEETEVDFSALLQSPDRFPVPVDADPRNRPLFPRDSLAYTWHIEWHGK